MPHCALLTCVVGSPMDCAATVPTTSPGAARAFMKLRRRQGLVAQSRTVKAHVMQGCHGQTPTAAAWPNGPLSNGPLLVDGPSHLQARSVQGGCLVHPTHVSARRAVHSPCLDLARQPVPGGPRQLVLGAHALGGQSGSNQRVEQQRGVALRLARQRVLPLHHLARGTGGR